MAKVRVSQTWMEVVTADEGTDLRVSQALLEVLGRVDDKVRVSQALLEVVGRRDGAVRVSQAQLDVVGVIAGPAIPQVTASNITASSADLTGTAFEQGSGGDPNHSQSRWLVRNINTGVIEYDSGALGTGVDLLTHSVPTGSLPGYSDLIPSAMYMNQFNEWSYFPGTGTQFQTLVDPAYAAVGLKFYDASWTLLSTHVTPGTTDTAYGDWTKDQDIPVPASTRYIVPCVYKVGSALDDVRVKEMQIDKGRISGGYHPSSFRPELHDETDIPPALIDEGQVTTGFEIDWALGNVATVELAANATMSWANLKPGGRYWLIVEQGAGGSHLLTWDAAAKHPSGVAPTLSITAGSKDVFHIIAESASIAHVETVSLDSK